MPSLLSGAVYALILGLAVAASRVVLGAPLVVVWGVVVIVAIALLITLRESFGNFAATMIFLIVQPFWRGDLIETMEHMGTVHELSLFNTALLLPEDRLVSLPNSKIQESGVINCSRLGHVRAAFTLTVNYGEDLSHVRPVITEVAALDERILTDPPFEVVVNDLSAYGARLLLLPPVAPANYWAVRNDLRGRIKARFDAEGIRFAVPQRAVCLAPSEVSDRHGMWFRNVRTLDPTASAHTDLEPS
jgi:small conductance mechanosensitive channel